MNVVPVDAKTTDWPRRVANAINRLSDTVARRATMPFDALATAPTGPVDGTTYFDTTLGKVRTWAGGAWHDHW